MEARLKNMLASFELLDLIEDEQELWLNHSSECLTQSWRDARRSFSSQCFNTSIEFADSKEVTLLHIGDRRIWHFWGNTHVNTLMINNTVQELGMFGLYILLMSTKERTIECHNCEHCSIAYPVEPFVQTRGSVFKLKECILNEQALVHLYLQRRIRSL